MAGDAGLWPPHYVEGRLLGKGSYGEVVEARDSRNNQTVAIKKQFTNFTTMDNHRKPVLALRAYRELLLLWTFRGHNNILYLLDAFPLQTEATMATLCIVTEKMDMDLSAALGRGRTSSVLPKQRLITPEMIPLITYGILCGLKYIHSADVFHRDLKPSNIGISFLNGTVISVKLLDFGLARKLKLEMSYVVQTMWYRAPEVMLSNGQYSKAIDIWSVGCIIAELITGKALMPGEAGIEGQLELIYERLGEPDGATLVSFQAEKRYDALLAAFRLKTLTPLEQVVPDANEQEMELMRKMVTWNAASRSTAAECLRHSYFASLVMENGESINYTPNQDFEDWRIPSPTFWSGWVDRQIVNIRDDLAYEAMRVPQNHPAPPDGPQEQN